MRYIIGYGNNLRAEDAFGLDVVNKLETQKLLDTKYFSLFQLTPELVLDLVDAGEIIFIDACCSTENNYALACSLDENIQSNFGLTHHISYKVILSMLNSLYNQFPTFQVYSMLTNNFDTIEDKTKYEESIDQAVNYLVKELS